jgi:beta-glucosidase
VNAGSAVAEDSPSAAMSPTIAADAPWTKTVTYLVDQMTPSEQMNLIEGSHSNKNNVDNTKDPDSHNQAGYVRPIKRLGIPEMRHADALGIEGFADSTAYPTRLGLAGTFDRETFNKFGVAEGTEGKALDMDLLYGPQVDLARTPSWSRNMTAYSEDPYVASQLGAEEINGIQSTGLLSQVKHVSFYSGQTQATPSIVDEQAAREIYLAPAESAVKDAGVTSMMCSYATFQIKGFEAKPDYSCSNSGMLNQIIKGEWKFPGWITTDYGGGKATSDLLAGTDQEFSTTFFSDANLLKLIDPTSDSYDPAYASAARNSAARIVYQYERFGLLDNDHIPDAYESSVPQTGDVDTSDNSINVDKAAGIKIAQSLAEESATLLKNNSSALPLSKDSSVAVFGQSARLLPASPGGERAIGFGDRVNISPYKAMKSEAGAKVTSEPGLDILGDAIPATAFTTDSAGTTPGLTRTTTELDGVTTSTSTDTVLDGKQANLVKGKSYTWTGYVNVTNDDTYKLLIQRPYGTDLGDDAKYNQNIRNASNSTVTLAVDGANKTLANPDNKILQNAYPTYATGVTGVQTKADNGQYLGYENVVANVPLTPGRHQVSITYKPKTTAATTPTLRFAWSATGAALQKAATAAAANDVSVVFVDDSSAKTGDGESAQTDVAQLSDAQNQLVTTVATAAHAAGKKVVVVLNTGSAVQMPWVDNVDGILEMWYPGQEGGTATSNTLYGKSNPSGKLTLSFPKTSAQTLFAGHPERAGGTQDAGEATKTIKWTEDLDIGYRWFESAANTNNYSPLFAFGHGLSYTDFAYSGLNVKNAKNGGLDVTFTVKNTGSVDGAESPQVYAGKSSELPSDIKQATTKVVQFDHIDLKAGESKTVTLNVAPRDLSSWSIAEKAWVLGTGDRKISVGAASDDIRLTATKNVPESVTAPAVTTNPVAASSTSVGQTVTLTAAGTGSPAPTVAWQKSTDGGTSWINVPGAASTTYSFTATIADNKAQYRAVFSNELGDAASTPTVLTVAKAKATVSASLAKRTVSAKKHGKVKITISAPAGVSTSGKVSIDVRSGGKSRGKVTGTVKAGKVTVTLPKLKKGSYSVTSSYKGNSSLASAKGKTLTLKVVK